MMAWRAYLHQLRTRPQLVKACTSGTTFTLTDLIAQTRERSAMRACDPTAVRPYDPQRTIRNGLFGFLWLGPINHVFWGTTPFGLEYWFPGPSWRAVFSRVFVDQITVMPLNMVMFLAWPALTTGQGIEAAMANVRASFIDGVLFAWGIWPFVHPLSFRYVPLEHRLLVLNVCSLGVFTYATWVSERNAARENTSSVGPGGSRLARTPTEKAASVAAAG